MGHQRDEGSLRSGTLILVPAAAPIIDPAPTPTREDYHSEECGCNAPFVAARCRAHLVAGGRDRRGRDADRIPQPLGSEAGTADGLPGATGYWIVGDPRRPVQWH